VLVVDEDVESQAVVNVFEHGVDDDVDTKNVAPPTDGLPEESVH
jgi:hypothetical protein